jgi:3-oxoacyl-[acyl-carrier-protein] synthase-3
VLLCTQSPDYFLPTTACILQDKLELKKSIGALDFNLGCSGFVYGLALAKGLVETGMAKNLLLITSETYTKFIHPKDKSNLTIFGDAAAATLITEEPEGGKIENFIFGTDGSGAENLIVKQGGMRFPVNGEVKDVVDEFGNITNDKNIYMNGSAIFTFTLDIVPNLISDVLKKHQLNEDEIDLYVFHQANKYMLNHLRKKLNVPEEKFFIYLENCANTVSSTIPIALREAQNLGKIIAGKKVLLAGFGVGYSWAGCIINY